MRVVVIGGGAAGLTTAWLLDRQHQVVLLERQPTLGGSVRTAGLNVHAPRAGDLRLDAGVIELEANYFPAVFRLLTRLGVAVERVPGATSLTTADGTWYPSRKVFQELHGLERTLTFLRMIPLTWAQSRYLERTDLPPEALITRTFGEFLEDGPTSTWMELLTLYAYSTPRPLVRGMSAGLVVPMLADFMRAGDWFRVVGGVYTYLARMQEQLRGEVHTGVEVTGVRRGEQVEVDVEGMGTLHADAVVFATPPDQVLRLLHDPSEHERRCFGAWKGLDVHTVVHDDPGLYTRRGIEHFSEFDLFDLGEGRGGYNAYLNRLCGIPTDRGTFGLAFGMDDEIHPDRVIFTQAHHVPSYTVDALRHRHEVVARNGEERTWFAGAWLHEGLHEGAITSALEVSRALGGELF